MERVLVWRNGQFFLKGYFSGDNGSYVSMRLLPHDQNTGGFFVCVLEKAMPVETAAKAAKTAASKPAEAKDVESATNATKRAATPSTPEGARESKKAKAEGDAVEGEAAQVEGEAVADGDSVKAEIVDADGDVAEPIVEEAATKKEKKDWSYKEDPFSYVDPAHAELDAIR